MDLSKLLILIISVMSLVSCVSYHPQPLHDESSQRLTVAKKNALVQQALQLQHPQIQPIQLDFSKPLTAEELAVVAVLINPDLKALRAKAGVAKAQVFDAGLLPDPQFNWSFEHPLYQTDPLTIPFTNAYSLGLTWDLMGLISRHAKIKSAKAQYQQTRYDLAWQEWLVANQAELLATRSYFLQQQINVAIHAQAISKNLLDITQKNLLNHDAKIDEFGIRQSAYLDIQDQIQTLQRSLEKTQLQLNQVLGLTPTEPLRLHIMPIEVPAHLDADKLFKTASVTRLDLLALKAGYASQEAQVYQAVLGQFPHFNLGITRARDTGDVNTLGSSISFDIPLFNHNQGVIKIAQATREQLYLEYNARLDQTRADIAALVADLQQLHQDEIVLAHALPAFRKAESLMSVGLKTGDINLIAYQDVRASLLNKEIKLLTMQQETNEQMIALQIALGKPFFTYKDTQT